jgi:hypothetical protein
MCPNLILINKKPNHNTRIDAKNNPEKSLFHALASASSANLFTSLMHSTS